MITFAETETLLKTTIIAYKNGGVMPHHFNYSCYDCLKNNSTYIHHKFSFSLYTHLQ